MNETSCIERESKLSCKISIKYENLGFPSSELKKVVFTKFPSDVPKYDAYFMTGSNPGTSKVFC